MKRNIIFVLLMMVSTWTFAQEEQKKDFKSIVLNTDRGLYSRNGATVGRGIQAELGFNYEWTDDDHPIYKTDTYSPIQLKIRWALHHMVEINFAIDNNQIVQRAWNEDYVDKYNYWTPLDIGVRAQFIESKRKISTDGSFYVGIGVPTTMRKAEDEDNVLRPWVMVNRPKYATPEIAFMFTHHFGDRVSLTYNFGAKWTGMQLDTEATAMRPDLYYTVNVAVHAHEMVDVYVEHFNFMRELYFPTLGMNGGVRVAAFKKLTFDINGGLGFNDVSPEAFAGIGLSYKMGRLK